MYSIKKSNGHIKIDLIEKGKISTTKVKVIANKQGDNYIITNKFGGRVYE